MHIKFPNIQIFRHHVYTRGIQVITVCELPHYKTKLKSTSLSTLAHCTKHQAGANRFVSVCRFCWYQCSHCENLVFLHLQKLPFFSPSAYSEKIRMAGVSFPRLLSLRIKCSICETSLSTFQKKDFSEFFRVLPLSRCLSNICKKCKGALFALHQYKIQISACRPFNGANCGMTFQ